MLGFHATISLTRGLSELANWWRVERRSSAVSNKQERRAATQRHSGILGMRRTISDLLNKRLDFAPRSTLTRAYAAMSPGSEHSTTTSPRCSMTTYGIDGRPLPEGVCARTGVTVDAAVYLSVAHVRSLTAQSKYAEDGCAGAAND